MSDKGKGMHQRRNCNSMSQHIQDVVGPEARDECGEIGIGQICVHSFIHSFSYSTHLLRAFHRSEIFLIIGDTVAEKQQILCP